jgi:hypothetical protein
MSKLKEKKIMKKIICIILFISFAISNVFAQSDQYFSITLNAVTCSKYKLEVHVTAPPGYSFDASSVASIYINGPNVSSSALNIPVTNGILISYPYLLSAVEGASYTVNISSITLRDNISHNMILYSPNVDIEVIANGSVSNFSVSNISYSNITCSTATATVIFNKGCLDCINQIVLQQNGQTISTQTADIGVNQLVFSGISNGPYTLINTCISGCLGDMTCFGSQNGNFSFAPLQPITATASWQRDCTQAGRGIFSNSSSYTMNALGAVIGPNTNRGFDLSSVSGTSGIPFTINQANGCTFSSTASYIPHNLAVSGIFTKNCDGTGSLAYSVTGGSNSPISGSYLNTITNTTVTFSGPSPIAITTNSNISNISVTQGACEATNTVSTNSLGSSLLINSATFQPNACNAAGGTLTVNFSGAQSTGVVSLFSGGTFLASSSTSPIVFSSSTLSASSTVTLSQNGCSTNPMAVAPLPSPASLVINSATFQPNACNVAGGTLTLNFSGAQSTGAVSLFSGGTFLASGSTSPIVFSSSTLSASSTVTLSQNGCSTNPMTVTPLSSPPSLSVSATLTRICGSTTGNLTVSGGTGGVYDVELLSSSGSFIQILGTSTLPADFTYSSSSSNIIRITGGGCSGIGSINVSTSQYPDYEIDPINSSYFYCDPKGVFPNQDGAVQISLQGNYTAGVYEVFASENGSLRFLFEATLSGNKLIGRVDAPPTLPNLRFRNQVFKAVVNKKYTSCKTREANIIQKANESMQVQVIYPPECLTAAEGDVVTLHFTITADYVKNYNDRKFFVLAYFSPPLTSNGVPTGVPYNSSQNPQISSNPEYATEGKEIQAVGIDDVNGIYTFSMTLNQRAPFRLNRLAVTHITHNAPAEQGEYHSKCYKDPIGVGKTFMPYLPPATLQLSGNCSNTYGGAITFNPLICNLKPAIWEVVSTNSSGVVTVVRTLDGDAVLPVGTPPVFVATPTTCTTNVSLNVPSDSQSLSLRHKLTQCSMPISITGGVIGGSGQTQGITVQDVCGGYELTAPSGYTTYTWNVGSQTTQSIIVSVAGTYQVIVSNATCTTTLSISVTTPSTTDLTTTLNYLDCNTVKITANNAFDTYTWFDSNGQQVSLGQIFTTTIADTYTLIAYKAGLNGGCRKEKQIEVKFPQLYLFAYPQAYCSSYLLVASPGFNTYSWSNGQSGSQITVTNDGTYTLTATIDGCTQTATVTIDALSNLITNSVKLPGLTTPNVLSTSASTFSEQWLRTGSSAIVSESGFGNGKRGIWKPQETYAYINQRQRAMNVSEFITPEVAKDGVFDLSLFNWKYYGALTCPSWIKTQQITQYDAFNFEIENKDILDRYTAALYGYKHQLPIATAGNAKVDEIAFESFEEYSQATISLTESMTNDNNLDLSTSTAFEWKPTYQCLVAEGMPKSGTQDHMVYVKGNVFTNWTGTSEFPMDVVVKGYRLDPDNPGVFIWKAQIISFRASSQNLTQLTLRSVSGEVPPNCYWKGEVHITQIRAFRNNVNAIMAVQSQEKHTGKKALKMQRITNNQLFNIYPRRIHFIPEKKYVLSAWVKLEENATGEALRNVDYTDKIYFTFTRYGDSYNTNISTKYSEIIEGWVRIEHEFTARAADMVIALYNNNTTNGVLYLDDIRIHPFNSSLQTYVYDTQNYKLRATLDGNNFSSLYYYDEQGNLYLTKKETERGVQTIQEALSHQPKK